MSISLTETQIQDYLNKLHGWALADDSIHKTYQFGSFSEAIGFITEMAFACEEANHHPEISNVYGTVFLRLRTHDAGNKVTQKDLDLAEQIEKLANKRVCNKTI
ncbi:MAG: 4a-hydroxytetrahydrobiopterin dehydratase [Verrucomicrobiota bacterium]|nr:4a-hydroxytetrahydrobiopterin dehydratase [Verrucomicrobiota bacterium]